MIKFYLFFLSWVRFFFVFFFLDLWYNLSSFIFVYLDFNVFRIWLFCFDFCFYCFDNLSRVIVLGGVEKSILFFIVKFIFFGIISGWNGYFFCKFCLCVFN